MNARDIISYGHKTFLDSIEGLTEANFENGFVTSSWTVKDVISHMASYELFILDVLSNLISPGTPTPYLDSYTKNGGQGFNDEQVSSRKVKSANEVLDEYKKTNIQVIRVIEKIDPDALNRIGTIPWYGEGYSIDDFIVYTNYGHKREHAAQIAIFKRNLIK